MSQGKRSPSRKKRTKIGTLLSAVSIELLGLIIFLMLLSTIREHPLSAEAFFNFQDGSHQANILPPNLMISENPEHAADRLDYRNY